MKMSVTDLKQIRDRVNSARELSSTGTRALITVHLGTCGIASGAGEILSTIKELVGGQQDGGIAILESGCAGLCSQEPMVTIQLAGEAPVKYASLSEETCRRIFQEHVLDGCIVEELAFGIGNERLP